jgi:hypothetical protein
MVPYLTLLDPPPQDYLTGDLGRVAPKIAGTRRGAVTRFHDVTPHAPRSLCWHGDPPDIGMGEDDVSKTPHSPQGEQMGTHWDMSQTIRHHLLSIRAAGAERCR